MFIFRSKRKEKPKGKITCEGCRFLAYNNDGSVYCESQVESACLKSEGRVFKEVAISSPDWVRRE